MQSETIKVIKIVPIKPTKHQKRPAEEHRRVSPSMGGFVFRRDNFNSTRNGVNYIRIVPNILSDLPTENIDLTVFGSGCVPPSRQIVSDEFYLSP